MKIAICGASPSPKQAPVLTHVGTDAILRVLQEQSCRYGIVVSGSLKQQKICCTTLHFKAYIHRSGMQVLDL